MQPTGERMQQESTDNDILLNVALTLEELITVGPEKGFEVSYQRDIPCRTCRHFENAPIKIKHCKTCQNRKVESVQQTQWLRTPPPHIDNHGMTIRYKGLGHYSPETGNTGRLIATYNVTKEDGVTIDGSDIINQLWATPFQAKVGGKIPVSGCTMGMEYLSVEPRHLKAGKHLFFDGKGGYRLNSKERGKLYFVVNILSEEEHPPSTMEQQATARIDALENDLEKAQLRIKELSTQTKVLEDACLPKGATETAWHAQGIKNLTTELLPSIDSLEKALANLSGPGDHAHREGIAMILELQEKALAKHDVVRITANGRKFDPHHHEAVGMTDGDGQPKNVVTEVLMEGYTHAGKLLRPAMVKVSSGR